MAILNAEKEVVNSPCMCCGHDEESVYLKMRFPEFPGTFEYRRCEECGLVFNSPRLTDLSQLYQGDYFYFWKSAEFMRQRMLGQVSRLIRPAELMLSGKRVLEVGSARGHFLHVLGKMGFEAEGVELSADAIESGKRNLGVEAWHGTVEAMSDNYLGEPYDLVVSSCVVEHVADPRSFLTACSQLLSDDGLMVFDVPNINSANEDELGAAWPYFQKYHVFLFNSESIERLLPQCGLELVKCFSYNNAPTPPKAQKKMKRMRRLLVTLDKLGLYRLFRRFYRGKAPDEQEAATAVKSITKAELETVADYAASPDAARPYASSMQGDHIVVVARKVASGV